MIVPLSGKSQRDTIIKANNHVWYCFDGQTIVQINADLHRKDYCLQREVLLNQQVMLYDSLLNDCTKLQALTAAKNIELSNQVDTMNVAINTLIRDSLMQIKQYKSRVTIYKLTSAGLFVLLVISIL